MFFTLILGLRKEELFLSKNIQLYDINDENNEKSKYINSIE